MKNKFEAVIITGISGAGKGVALEFLEDIGFFSVDNFPVAVYEKFMEVIRKSSIKKFAAVIDIRERNYFKYFNKFIAYLKDQNIKYRIIFMDASDKILINRFQEKRRLHPLIKKYKKISESIKKEREILKELRKKADVIIDTSNFNIWELQLKIKKLFDDKNETLVNIISFGYKYGQPESSSFVIDVRFLPNPYYCGKLKNLTGQNKKVKDYLQEFKQTRIFLSKLNCFLDFLMKAYLKEERPLIELAVGCTGGRHRSPFIAEEIAKRIKLKFKNIKTEILHRDIKK